MRTGDARGAQVWALLAEMRVGPAAGFDLSVMDRYRWHPGLERVELDRRAPSTLPRRAPRLARPRPTYTLPTLP